MKTLFRWLFRTVLFVVLLVILLVVTVTLLKIPIDLTIFKGSVETIASKAIKRPVKIDQSIVISTSLNPVFTVRGLRIGNPDGFSQETFINLGMAEIQVELLPFFQKKVSISEIKVQKLQLTLEELKSGAVNWVIATDKKTDEKESAKKEVTRTEAKTGSVDWAVNTMGNAANTVREAFNSIDWSVDTITVKKMMLQDIALYYYGPDKPAPYRHQITQCVGSMGEGKPLKLNLAGNLQSSPYSVKINIASLKEFLTENRSWIDIQAEIAGTKLSLGGDLNLTEAHQSLALKADVSGENLNSLNDLLDLDLPPFSPYNVKADLLLKNNHWEMQDLVVQAGSSSLSGTAQIITGDAETEAVITFSSPLMQLNDFIFDDWKWSEEEEVITEEPSDDTLSVPESAVAKKESSDGDKRKILDPEVLNNIDIALKIHSEKVLLGDEELGSGSLAATVRDGRITIEPLKLHVPGGSVELSASVKPGNEKSDASLRAVMRNFDIGIMARREQPESKMAGLVNLDVDLQSSAASVDQILANGNGYFDFSGNLENLSAGIIDLWAVNLIAAILSNSDENESNINCAVGRWQVNDGSLTPDVFFIDTSKIRICGNGQVDFSTNQIDMTISPTPKKPEFFSLATPLRVRGSFSDLRLGVKKGAKIGTAVNFITSPIHVPIRRAVTKKIPKDGRDACTVELGPDNRSESSVKGCK